MVRIHSKMGVGLGIEFSMAYLQWNQSKGITIREFMSRCRPRTRTILLIFYFRCKESQGKLLRSP